MSQKLSDNSLLIHRPKKRRNYLADQKSGQKSSNLKLLHQTLLCEESNHKQGAPERSSVARILASNRYSRKEIQE